MEKVREATVKLFRLNEQLIEKALNGELQCVIDCVNRRESQLFSKNVDLLSDTKPELFGNCINGNLNNDSFSESTDECHSSDEDTEVNGDVPPQQNCDTSNNGVFSDSTDSCESSKEDTLIVPTRNCDNVRSCDTKELKIVLNRLTEKTINAALSGKLTQVLTTIKKPENRIEFHDDSSTDISVGESSTDSDSESELSSESEANDETSDAESHYSVRIKSESESEAKSETESEAKSDLFNESVSSVSSGSSFSLRDSETDSSSDGSLCSSKMETECLNTKFSPLNWTNCFYCDFCEMQTFSIVNLMEHREKFHLSEIRIPCPICGVSFETSNECEEHKSEAHDMFDSHRCNLCGLIVSSFERLNEHVIKIHNDKKKAKCKYCGHFFRSHKFLSEHVKFSHYNERRQMNIRRRNDIVNSFE